MVQQAQILTGTAPSGVVSVKNDTEYHILRAIPLPADGPPEFMLVGQNVKALRAEAAIRKWAELAAKAGDDVSGRYVAVPSRSWKPQTVKTKVETSIVVEDVVEDAK